MSSADVSEESYSKIKKKPMWEVMPTWFQIYSSNYSEPTWICGTVSSVARHTSPNTYVVGRRFGRKLHKKLKNTCKKWCPLEFQYTPRTTVKLHGFLGPCRVLLAIIRKVLMSSADVSKESYRKGQNTRVRNDSHLISNKLCELRWTYMGFWDRVECCSPYLAK